LVRDSAASAVAAAESCTWAAAAAICASIVRLQYWDRLLFASEAGTNAAQLNCGGMKAVADG
jgi:hypothetical protein